MTDDILRIQNYRLNFNTFDGVYHALDGVNLNVKRGESLGIVGETGCGKSVTVRNILRLLPTPPAEVISGEILYEGQDLLKVTTEEMQRIRGSEIAMIFQDPMTYLNPVFTIGTQMVDVILAHQRHLPKERRKSRKQALQHAINMLEKVHLPNPDQQVKRYPHELSGGMRQRVLIAMALSGQPKLLIADEPTTALDVTIQAQILDLIAELVDELGLSVILITHDLGVVAKICDTVAVMYAGQVVEYGTVDDIFCKPKHPYTKGLLHSIPHPGKLPEALEGIPGFLPNLLTPPIGCRFMDRCSEAMGICNTAPKLITTRDDGRQILCHKYQEVMEHA
ncbi:ATP-binding cassette domain-containing protein [Sneathiella sp. P13V-1]|uniref:ABC transporter ATP-binding protein n=1 Tax=Sneathiella sp. P13V-1 TaxID=2697366 RepID=UPI00187B44EF|nr:ABC transporter ATP-binding protein [Sneathiella sp. P13V-1]MBE7637089.1 ATP-binding cassette domain-containing protein [Sneathiella sp. P13V-1]